MVVEQPVVFAQSIKRILESVGLEEYLDIFHQNDVDLAMFITLTEEDLKSIGIASLGHRKKIAAAINKYRPENKVSKATSFRVEANPHADDSSGSDRPNKLLIASSSACLLSMFLPWAGVPPVTVSGWDAASVAARVSEFAYLLYLFPVGAGMVFYSAISGKNIPFWARLTGFVPITATFVSLLHMSNNSMGVNFGQLLEAYFKLIVPNLGMGFKIALVCGLLLFFAPAKPKAV